MLLLLVLLLLFGHPARTAVAAATALTVVGVRGMPLVALVLVRLIVTGFGVAAGIALAGRRLGAPLLAQTALAMSAFVDLFTYVTPFAPSNRVPGDTPFYVAASLAYHGGWILYLRHSRRVKHEFTPRGPDERSTLR